MILYDCLAWILSWVYGSEIPFYTQNDNDTSDSVDTNNTSVNMRSREEQVFNVKVEKSSVKMRSKSLPGVKTLSKTSPVTPPRTSPPKTTPETPPKTPPEHSTRTPPSREVSKERNHSIGHNSSSARAPTPHSSLRSTAKVAKNTKMPPPFKSLLLPKTPSVVVQPLQSASALSYPSQCDPGFVLVNSASSPTIRPILGTVAMAPKKEPLIIDPRNSTHLMDAAHKELRRKEELAPWADEEEDDNEDDEEDTEEDVNAAKEVDSMLLRPAAVTIGATAVPPIELSGSSFLFPQPELSKTARASTICVKPALKTNTTDIRKLMEFEGPETWRRVSQDGSTVPHFFDRLQHKRKSCSESDLGNSTPLQLGKDRQTQSLYEKKLELHELTEVYEIPHDQGSAFKPRKERQIRNPQRREHVRKRIREYGGHYRDRRSGALTAIKPGTPDPATSVFDEIKLEF